MGKGRGRPPCKVDRCVYLKIIVGRGKKGMEGKASISKSIDMYIEPRTKHQDRGHAQSVDVVELLRDVLPERVACAAVGAFMCVYMWVLRSIRGV